MADFFGWNPPFFGGTQNVLSRQEDVRLIKNDILQLLLTVPGDRVMRPDFGVNLRNAVFELDDSVSIAAVEQEIITQLRTYEPRILSPEVTIENDALRQAWKVSVVATLKRDATKLVTVELFLANGGVV